VGKRFKVRQQQARGSDGALYAPPAGLGVEPGPQTHSGCTSPENASSGCKCHLVPVSLFDLTESLDAICLGSAEPRMKNTVPHKGPCKVAIANISKYILLIIHRLNPIRPILSNRLIEETF